MIIQWDGEWQLITPGLYLVDWESEGKAAVFVPDFIPPPTFLVYVPNVKVQEPPYDGPFNRDLFASPPFAVTDNPRNDEVRWCEVCRRPVVVDPRPLHFHPHFDQDEIGEEVGR